MSEYSQFPEDVATDDCLLKYSYIFSPDILKEKVAFITGGGSGIGFRIAEILMRHGCQTIIASRSLERVQASARKLTAATGQRCLPVSVDVRQPATIIAAVEETLWKFGKIDILVNGAAGNFLCPASGLSFNAFKTVLEIDTIGTFNTSKVLYQRWLKAIQWRSPLTERVGSNLPALSKEMTISCLSGGVGDSIVDLKPILGALLMAQLDHGGVIVNITATLSYRGQILQLHAGTAKAAIDAMTKHLAVEWGPDNIRVNSLAPGPISGTEGFRKLGGLVKSMADHYKLIPLQRVGTKTEIAHGVLYLVSPAASYVTGTLLVIDGGHWLTGANNMSAMQALLQKPAKL